MPAAAPESVWSATCPQCSIAGDQQLTGDLSFDVAIVGAGYTGLWTALSLLEVDPTIRVVVVERHDVGFGASGRNGGWCSALLPVSLEGLARRHGRDAVVAWQRAMIDTLAVVGQFCADSASRGHDPQFHKGGTVTVARREPQLRRLERDVAAARRFGFGDDDVRLLDAKAAADHLRVVDLGGATFTPHCAAVHPLRLVRAIAAAASRAGARIVECADVVDLEPHRLTFTVASHVVVYGQRTADGRIAFGGRGAPYHYGSRVEDRFDTDRRVRSALLDAVVAMLPPLRQVSFPYHWGGPLAAPRDWHPHVAYDRRTGIASAGGYVGDGLAAANLAGRTLADLICGRDTEITRLPWVGHRSRSWEPEPLRWLGVRTVSAAVARADRAEASAGPLAAARAAGWSKLATLLSGR
jgi:glycine/D-amino acid oxidase-like deaminating enzyme